MGRIRYAQPRERLYSDRMRPSRPVWSPSFPPVDLPRSSFSKLSTLPGSTQYTT
jgi:hypothetical protein